MACKTCNIADMLIKIVGLKEENIVRACKDSIEWPGYQGYAVVRVHDEKLIQNLDEFEKEYEILILYELC